MQDLLKLDKQDLALREGEDGVFIEGVHEAPVRDAAACMRLLQRGERNRPARPCKLCC